MPLSEWHQGNQALQRALRRAVVADLEPLVGRRLNDSAIDLITDRMFTAVTSGRAYSRRLARQYYTELVGAHGLGAPVAEPRPGDYERPALAEGLRRVLRPDGSTSVTSATIGKALQVGHKHVQDAGRRAMLAVVRRDDRISGWARADPNPPTCAFCLMLISRGPVYRSAASAGKSNSWHIRCSCQPVPVVRGDWPGRNQYEQAEALWAESTGGTATGRLNRFRRAMREQQLPAAADTVA